jgi:hypothetical protein
MRPHISGLAEQLPAELFLEAHLPLLNVRQHPPRVYVSHRASQVRGGAERFSSGLHISVRKRITNADAGNGERISASRADILR